MSFGKPVTGTDETLRPALMGVILNLLRTSSLGSKVPIDKVLNLVTSNWRAMYDAGTFDLQPLYSELVNWPGVTSEEVAEILLLLKQRESRLGVAIKLPPAVVALSPADQERLLSHVQKVGIQSGVTMSTHRRAVVPPPEEHKPEHAAEGLVDRVRAILNAPPPTKKK